MQYLTTEQIQDVLLDMLVKLDTIFNEHHIRYTLDGGTLLGAVRHKGFIPWDDDIDVLVPRPDFNRLAHHPEWAPQGYRFGIQGKNGYVWPFIKLFNLAWKTEEASWRGSLDEFLWVDVFPADSIPDSAQEEAQLIKKLYTLQHKATRSYTNIDRAVETSQSRAKALERRLLMPIYRQVFPAEKSYRQLTQLASAIPYGSTDKAGDLVWWPYKPDKPGFPISDFDNLVDLDFEGHKFKACPHWDDYLRGLYGDYMTLPPVEDRVTHGTKVWRADTTDATTKNGK